MLELIVCLLVCFCCAVYQYGSLLMPFSNFVFTAWLGKNYERS